jgi:hypothetical protein
MFWEKHGQNKHPKKFDLNQGLHILKQILKQLS